MSSAEVVANLKQARAEGSIVQGEAGHLRVTPIVSQVTRAEVHVQTLAAISSGEVHALSSETNGFEIVQRSAPAQIVTAGK